MANQNRYESLKVNFDALTLALTKKFRTDFQNDKWIRRLMEALESEIEGIRQDNERSRE